MKSWSLSMNKAFNSPTFTIKVLVPQHLDLPLNILHDMTEMELKNHIELVRLHLVQIIELKHPPFGSQMTEPQIIFTLYILTNYSILHFLFLSHFKVPNVAWIQCISRFVPVLSLFTIFIIFSIFVNTLYTKHLQRI